MPRVVPSRTASRPDAGRWRQLVGAWPLAIIVVGACASVVWTAFCLWLACRALVWALD